MPAAPFVRDPFPHIVVENALDDAVYERLEAAYPHESLIRSAKSVANRQQLMARDIVGNSTIHSLWRDFVQHHISPAFFGEILACFAPSIRRLYPWLESDRGRSLEEFTVGLRDPDAASLPRRVSRLPARSEYRHVDASPPRTAHLDASNKLLSGLLYMRCPENRTSGGNFVLYKLTSDRPRFDTPPRSIPTISKRRVPCRTGAIVRSSFLTRHVPCMASRCEMDRRPLVG